MISLRRFEINLRSILFLMTLLVVLGATISGCSPFYVIRAAYEEGKILWRREPIPEYLEKPDLAPDVEDKLKLVLAVRDYARDVLKLNVGGSYSSYSYVDRPDLTYILTAAPRTELRPYTWWFLIVGRVPYKGYFSREEASAAAKGLEEDGYDTNIRTSAAFSTLGWFDDPLLSHLLRYDKVTLAEVVFHELFHNTLYIKGAGAFNESSANFVGGRSAIDFFRDRFGENSPEHQRAVRAWEEELEFSDFLETLTHTLNELYERDIPYEDKLRLREEVFARSQAEWARRIANPPGHRFRSFAQQPLNNAVIINYFLYLKNLKLFEALYQAEGKDLPRTIGAIKEAVANGGEPFDAVRKRLDTLKNQAVVKSAVE
ncbi:MAG TPA: aminopeptidase [Candidatus Binatia bacterium]